MCCGGLRDCQANFTEAQADHHPKAPARQPPLRASLPILTSHNPPMKWFLLIALWGAVGNLSHQFPGPPFHPHLLLLQTNSFYYSCDHRAASISRILAGRLARGREAGRARGGSGQPREAKKARADWSLGITCRCLLTSPFVPHS